MIAQSFTHRALRRIWRPIHKTLVPRLVRNGASPGPRTILIQLTYRGIGPSQYAEDLAINTPPA